MHTNNYQVDIQILDDASVRVKENIDVYFNEKRRGIFRNIPKAILVNGEKIKVELTDVEVQNHKFKMLNENNNRVIRIGDPDIYLTGQQTYNISYTLKNIFLFAETHTEFNYNIIHDWDSPVDSVSFSIRLPDDVELGFNDYRIVTGSTGSDERNASIQYNNNILTGSSLRPLGANEGITVYTKLPKDSIMRPAPPVPLHKKDKYWFIPVGFIILFINYFQRNRKSHISFESTQNFFPPEGLNPPEVGMYHDYKVNTEDIISLLPYWANKGYIEIMSNGMDGKDHDLYFKRIKDLESELPDYQHQVFNAVFRNDDLVLLSELKNKIYSVIYPVSKKIKKRLLQKELYDQIHYKRYHTGWLIGIGVLAIICGVAIMITSGLILSGISLIITGIVLFVMHFLRPKYSEKGLILKQKLDALKQSLKNSSPEKNLELMKSNPGYFEMIFPFAIALGVDSTWLSKFKDYDLPAPYWYGYYGPHHTHHSSASMNDFSSGFSIPEIKSVFTSYPASSGTGGSSGGGGFSGGSSGGGFGGGGGSW